MQSSSPRHDNNSARTDVESRGSGTTTITQVNQPEDNTENGNHLLLRLEQPSTSENTTERNSPRVQWTEDTDCESDHCRGHKGKAQKPEGGGGGDDHDGGPPVQT
uniref:Uncharacterized protein n=1 Tax=Meloidogyne floridensis TaxID=298350 RepID=A0A915NSX4_9BILA